MSKTPITDGSANLSPVELQRSKPVAGRADVIVEFFERPFMAVMFTAFLLFVAAIAYTVGHSGKNSGQDYYDTMLASALKFSPDGRFEPSYDDSVLGRFFAPVKIVEIKERIAAKADAARRQTERERRQLLEPLRAFLDRSVSDSGPLTSPPVANGEADAGWSAIDLCQINRWIAAKDPFFHDTKRIDRDYYLDALAGQICREEIRKKLLKRELRSLDSGLSFAWLKIDGAYWVLEVIGWTVFGFLANTLITLFLHCRKRTYSPDEFVLIFPKLVLAPLLSVVAIALWCSGISSAPINFLNLPIFLIFAFSLGFCTEQLYVAIKDITAWFISRFVKVSEDRVAELAKNVPYAFVNTPPAAVVPAPENLKQLREQAEAAAKAGFERGTVAKLSSLS